MGKQGKKIQRLEARVAALETYLNEHVIGKMLEDATGLPNPYLAHEPTPDRESGDCGWCGRLIGGFLGAGFGRRDKEAIDEVWCQHCVDHIDDKVCVQCGLEFDAQHRVDVTGQRHEDHWFEGESRTELTEAIVVEIVKSGNCWHCNKAIEPEELAEAVADLGELTAITIGERHFCWECADNESIVPWNWTQRLKAVSDVFRTLPPNVVSK